MSKLTLRQFTDVVKALMEASLTKEYGIRLEIMEEPDEISDDGVKMTLKVEKESIKECTKSGKMCETYSCDCNVSCDSKDGVRAGIEAKRNLVTSRQRRVINYLQTDGQTGLTAGFSVRR